MFLVLKLSISPDKQLEISSQMSNQGILLQFTEF